MYGNNYNGRTPYANSNDHPANNGTGPGGDSQPFWWPDDILDVMDVGHATSTGNPFTQQVKRLWHPNVDKQLGIWRCPENTLQTQWHSLNPNLGGPSDNASYTPNGFNGDEERNQFLSNRYRMMRHPSELAALFDGASYQYTPRSQDAVGVVLRPGGDVLSSPPPEATGARWVRYVHNGNANMLYADGHAGTRQRWIPGRGARLSGAGEHSDVWTNGKLWYAN